jgi:hypothetical protein
VRRVFHHIYISVAALIMANDVTDIVDAGRYHFSTTDIVVPLFGRKNMATLTVMGSFTMV